MANKILRSLTLRNGSMFCLLLFALLCATSAYASDPQDRDGDGIYDLSDNCPDNFNPAQDNFDGDLWGDVCDNCPFDYTLDQNDNDSDGIGNACDNCPDNYNQDQSDSDGDGIGDSCDTCPNDFDNDSDGDGVCGNVDNCPVTNNPDQTDPDSDGFGDACDNCPDNYDTSQSDFDNDGVGDVCDNCLFDYNNGQEDTDGDSIGDACDFCPNDETNDGDGDGTCQNFDNCPNNFNPDQEDIDSDGMGDPCDDDKDGDGLPNEWEDAYGLSTIDNGSGAFTNGAAGDQDGDYASNFDEYVADTDPNQSSSVFRVSTIKVSSPPTLTWSSSAARVYQVYYNTNLLSGAWSPLVTGVAGSNSLISISDTNNANQRNYQLKVGFPP